MHKKENNDNTNLPGVKSGNEDEINFAGYPLYPVNEDIYNMHREEENINPENISKLKEPNENGKNNEKGFEEDMSGNDLDIPGSELDDDEENVGNEDEENNYYSLGGDNLKDL